MSTIIERHAEINKYAYIFNVVWFPWTYAKNINVATFKTSALILIIS